MIGAETEGGEEKVEIGMLHGLDVHGVFEGADDLRFGDVEMFVVAIVRHVAAEDVGERAVGIGARAEKLVAEGVVMVLDERVGDVVVDGVFADEQEGTDDRCDDEIDPSGVVGVFGGGLADGVVMFAADGVGKATFVEDAGFAEGTDLGESGVAGGPE